jgi:hypothetical protein
VSAKTNKKTIMTISKIIGENGEMPKLCNGGTCPSAILVDGGEVIIQGYVTSSEQRTHLTGPAGEDFVKMPRAVFERIARQVLNS